MSIIDTLITDRSQSDVDRALTLSAKGWAGMTAAEREEFEAGMKGSYNATDLNRVNAAMEYLDTRLKAMGYTGGYYQPVEVPHKQGGGSRLPEGYTEVAYIQSTGTQYIDTGVIADQGIGFEIKFQTQNAVATSGYGTIFGALVSATSRYALSTYPDASHGGFGYGSGMYDAYITTGQVETISFLDGVLTTSNGQQTVDSQTFNLNLSLTLFGRHNSGGVTELSSDYLYYMRLYSNGSLIRDYVPCINPSGEAGLYDTVNGAFYGNAGSGSFLSAPVPADLPEGYTQVEYIQSDGNQYVDTGFKPNQDTRVVMDFELLSVTGQYADPIFGVRTSASSNAYYFWCSGTLVAAEQYQSGYNNGSVYLAAQRVGRHTVDKDKNVTTVDGVTTAQSAYAAFTASWNLLLFQSYNNGSLYSQTTHMRLYACQLYDDGTLIRDYVPCTNPSGAAGLYDTVGQQFYGNAGTGAFTAGPSVPAPAPEPEPEPELDPYTWYKEDIPTPEALEAYLDNVRRFRSAKALFATTPQVPEDMVLATIDEWNDIERILVDIETSLISIAKAAIYAGTPYIFAGGPMIYATGG